MLAAVEGLDQPHYLRSNAEEQLHGLFHIGPARALMALPCHRRSFLPAPCGFPQENRSGDPAAARITCPG